MQDSIVTSLCLFGLWILLAAILWVETNSTGRIGVAWRNANINSQVSKNVRAICIPAFLCLCYLAAFIKVVAYYGASPRALFGLTALEIVAGIVMVGGLLPIRYPADWYPTYPDPLSEQWPDEGDRRRGRQGRLSLGSDTTQRGGGAAWLRPLRRMCQDH